MREKFPERWAIERTRLIKFTTKIVSIATEHLHLPGPDAKLTFGTAGGQGRIIVEIFLGAGQ